MKFSKLFLVALGSVSLLISCSKEDEIIVDNTKYYNQGVLILNEGSSGQGSVSYISDDLINFTQDVYSTANGEDLFGKYAQSIFFNGDYAYIIVGGSNTINVVNRKTFKLIAKIETGLVAPRYGVAIDGKAYVTNANTYSYANPTSGNTDDYIAVINLTSNVVESTIPLNATANRIVLENGKLYITEPFNNDKLLVVNPDTKTLEASVEIGRNADTMEAKDGTLYILKSSFDSASEIVKVKLSDASLTTITFPSDMKNVKNLDIDQNKIYYTLETSVYGIDIMATEASNTAILSYTSTSEYGKMYGFAVNNNRIYIGDAGDFSADSKAYIYTLSGTLEKELTVGVGPNGFYFN